MEGRIRVRPPARLTYALFARALSTEPRPAPSQQCRTVPAEQIVRAEQTKPTDPLKAGRAPKSAPRDEMAIYAFVKELYATRRVSNATYARVHKLLGDAGMVELTGILGYYVLISMTLNVFRMPLPEGEALPFAEPSVK